MKVDHNKLVRDKIPDIIRANGDTPVTRILSDEEYKIELLKKFDEELSEFKKAKNIEELADIAELIDAAAVMLGKTFEDVLREKAVKQQKRGGFIKKILLEFTK